MQQIERGPVWRAVVASAKDEIRREELRPLWAVSVINLLLVVAVLLVVVYR